MPFIIQIREAGQWFPCTDTAETLEDALILASALTPAVHEDSIRIVGPDGEVV